MDTDFEAVAGEPGAKLGGHGVAAFGNEIKRGPKAQFHFQLGELLDAVQTLLALDIVSKDHRELLAVRPAWPALGRAFRARHDRPDVANPAALPHRKPPANG